MACYRSQLSFFLNFPEAGRGGEGGEFFARHPANSSRTVCVKGGPPSSLQRASIPRRCQVSPGGAERPSWDSPRQARGASGGCRLLSSRREAPSRLPFGVRPRLPRQGKRLACSTSGAFAALRPPSRVSPPRPCPVLLPRGSGREGGVSGAGGRDLYKSAGGAPAGASLAALRRDWERCGKARAGERTLRSGYPMRGLSAAAARAICWSSRTSKRSRHTAAWTGSQRCLSL